MDATRISKILQATKKNFVCPTTNKHTYCTSDLQAMYLRKAPGRERFWDGLISFELISILYLHKTDHNTFKVSIGRWG